MTILDGITIFRTAVRDKRTGEWSWHAFSANMAETRAAARACEILNASDVPDDGSEKSRDAIMRACERAESETPK